jgi:undecaprenyl-diphosphatase
VDEYLRAIFLGALQAATEFLPISSSGHLLLAETLLGGETASPTFDVGLHVGTLVAVLLYFRQDWIDFTRSFFEDLGAHGLRLGRWSARGKLLLAIALSTVPAVLAGFFFNDLIEEYLRAPAIVGVNLVLFGVLLWWADRLPEQHDLSKMNYRSALEIGLAQAIALMPGVSRSGATMTAARALAFDRASAARFSFLMSAPVVFAAAVLELGKAATGGEAISWGPMLAGALAAAIVGWLVIAGLLSFLRTRTLSIFVWYRIALGIIVLAAVAVGAV